MPRPDLTSPINPPAAVAEADVDNQDAGRQPVHFWRLQFQQIRMAIDELRQEIKANEKHMIAIEAKLDALLLSKGVAG